MSETIRQVVNDAYFLALNEGDDQNDHESFVMGYLEGHFNLRSGEAVEGVLAHVESAGQAMQPTTLNDHRDGFLEAIKQIREGLFELDQAKPAKDGEG